MGQTVESIRTHIVVRPINSVRPTVRVVNPEISRPQHYEALLLQSNCYRHDIWGDRVAYEQLTRLVDQTIGSSHKIF